MWLRCITGNRSDRRGLTRIIDRTRAPLGLDRVKTIFGNRKRPCRRKLREGRYEVVVETPTYDLTVFNVHYGKLTLKIYTKGERVLRIEVIVHNSKELLRNILDSSLRWTNSTSKTFAPFVPSRD